MISELIALGVRDGLIWLPIILGFAILHRHLRHIDVSVDGVVILAGIAAATAWNETHSILVSFVVSVVVSTVLSSTIAGFYAMLGVPQLMVGIIFSLVAHAVSVLWIGESARVNGTSLLTGMSIPVWLPVLDALLVCLAFWFMRTRTGNLIKKYGDGVRVNTVREPFVLLVAAYASAGSLYGVGAALYVHKVGVARAGGSFDVLVVALCSYMSIQRLLEFVSVQSARRATSRGGVRHSVVGSFLAGPEMAAIGGACFYGLLVHLAIAFSPDPRLWKVALATTLLVSVIDFKSVRNGIRLTTNTSVRSSSVVTVGDVFFSYKSGDMRRSVLEAASATFGKGLAVLVGPNGSGKSTLLRLIAGYERIDEGSILVNGREVRGVCPSRRSVFFVPQNARDALGESLTVRELLSVSAKRRGDHYSRGGADQLLVERLAGYQVDSEKLTTVGFDPRCGVFWDQRVSALSGGQATIVAIYASVLSDAHVILLDEPTNGVDQRHFEVIADLLRAMANDHCVIATTHDARLRSVADSVMAMQDRSIVSTSGYIETEGRVVG